MVAPHLNPHLNTDSATGNCLDCGARKEHIDDNLFPTCDPATGPHRVAIIAVRNAMKEQEAWSGFLARAESKGETENAWATQERRRAAEEAGQLRASLAFLLQQEGGEEATAFGAGSFVGGRGY